MDITKKILNEYFIYNPETGDVYNKIQRGNRGKVGAKVGTVAKNSKTPKYKSLRITFFSKNYELHRLIWIMNYGDIPKGMTIDHIDQNPLNNKIINLRIVSKQDQMKNLGLPKHNTSGVVGVWYAKHINKWISEIRESGKKKHIGCFIDKCDAISARKRAEAELGYHKNHGGSHNAIYI